MPRRSQPALIERRRQQRVDRLEGDWLRQRRLRSRTFFERAIDGDISASRDINDRCDISNSRATYGLEAFASRHTASHLRTVAQSGRADDPTAEAEPTANAVDARPIASLPGALKAARTA